ncbi:basic proline-rich protein-like [Pogoniulus pusillus]|uniref:basic proline-rich protein-like n=1 Tax=Pogoniulus pusillus TaxID=488313 RepID=UPI0030B9A53E
MLPGYTGHPTPVTGSAHTQGHRSATGSPRMSQRGTGNRTRHRPPSSAKESSREPRATTAPRAAARNRRPCRLPRQGPSLGLTARHPAASGPSGPLQLQPPFQPPTACPRPPSPTPPPHACPPLPLSGPAARARPPPQRPLSSHACLLPRQQPPGLPSPPGRRRPSSLPEAPQPLEFPAPSSWLPAPGAAAPGGGGTGGAGRGQPEQPRGLGLPGCRRCAATEGNRR